MEWQRYSADLLVEFVAETGADINQIPFGDVWAWVQARAQRPMVMAIMRVEEIIGKMEEVAG